MKQIHKRLTYANVMSSIAVFLVLGGKGAFGAPWFPLLSEQLRLAVIRRLGKDGDGYGCSRVAGRSCSCSRVPGTRR